MAGVKSKRSLKTEAEAEAEQSVSNEDEVSIPKWKRRKTENIQGRKSSTTTMNDDRSITKHHQGNNDVPLSRRKTRSSVRTSESSAKSKYSAAMSSEDEDVHQENHLLSQRVSDLTRKNEDLTVALETLQQRAVKGDLQGKSHVQDDRLIGANCRTLSKRIQDWAADMALPGTIQLACDKKCMAEIFEMLMGQRAGGPEYQIAKQARFYAFLLMHGGPRCALQAMIEHYVAFQILEKPFHFLPPGLVDIESLQREMDDKHFAKKLWPSTTIRTFYRPEDFAGTLSQPIIEDRFKTYRDDYYDDITLRIVGRDQSPLYHLLRSEVKTSLELHRAKLRRILASAGKLSLQLWAQDITVNALGLGFSCDTPESRPVFKSKPDQVEPHAVMKGNPENIALNKHTLALVVRPAIQCERHDSRLQSTRTFIAVKALLVVPSPASEQQRKSGTNISTMSRADPLRPNLRSPQEEQESLSNAELVSPHIPHTEFLAKSKHDRGTQTTHEPKHLQKKNPATPQYSWIEEIDKSHDPEALALSTYATTDEAPNTSSLSSIGSNSETYAASQAVLQALKALKPPPEHGTSVFNFNASALPKAKCGEAAMKDVVRSMKTKATSRTDAMTSNPSEDILEAANKHKSTQTTLEVADARSEGQVLNPTGFTQATSKDEGQDDDLFISDKPFK